MLMRNIYEEKEPEKEGDIQIRGYGKLTPTNAKRSVINKLEGVLRKVKENPNDPLVWKNLKHVCGDGVTSAFLDAIVSSLESK